MPPSSRALPAALAISDRNYVGVQEDAVSFAHKKTLDSPRELPRIVERGHDSFHYVYRIADPPKSNRIAKLQKIPAHQ